MLHARLSIFVSQSSPGPEEIRQSLPLPINPLTLRTTPLTPPYPLTLSGILFPLLSRVLFFLEDWLPVLLILLLLPSIPLLLYLLLGLFDYRLPLRPFDYRLTLLSTSLLAVPLLRLPIDSPTCLLFHPVPSHSGGLTLKHTLPASLPPSLDPTTHPLRDPSLMSAAVAEPVGRRRSKRTSDPNAATVVRKKTSPRRKKSSRPLRIGCVNAQGLPYHKWKAVMRLVDDGVFDYLFVLETWYVDHAARRPDPRVIATTDVPPGPPLPSGHRPGGIMLLGSPRSRGCLRGDPVVSGEYTIMIPTCYGRLTGIYLPPSLTPSRWRLYFGRSPTRMLSWVM
jgi:hypothetical protein